MKKKIHYITLILLIAFHLINILFWFNMGSWPTGKDWYWHMHNTFKMLSNLNNEFSFENLTFIDITYPPMYYWSGILLIKVFSLNNALFLNAALYFIILILSMYALGTYISNRNTGILLAVIVSFFPAIYKSSIHYNLALPVAALTTLCAYLLLRSEQFANRKFTILAGIALGGCVILRELSILFLIGPIMLCLWSLKQNRKINIFIFLTLVTLISTCVHDWPLKALNLITRLSIAGKIQEASIFSWSHMIFYIKAIPGQIGWVNTVLCVLGLYQYRKLTADHRKLLFAWFLIPLIALTFIRLKHTEYTLSYLPVLGVSIALFLNEISKKTSARVITVLLISASMCQYFLTFGLSE